MERPSNDDSALPPDPPPGSDPEPTPRFPRPETRAKKAKVTPLDPDKHIEDGIEVKET